MKNIYIHILFLIVLFIPLNISAADRVHFTNIYSSGTAGGTGSSSGEATLVESNGHYGLIDTGNPHNTSDPYYQSQLNGKTVANYLKNNGCTHLDFILITHAHSDHVGGIPYLYSAGYIDSNTTFIYKEFQTGNTAEGVGWNTQKYFNDAKNTMQTAGAKMLEVSSKTGLDSLNARYINNGGNATDYIEFEFQNFNIKVFNLYYAAKNVSENHNSLVVLIDKNSQKILLKSELGIPDPGNDSREQDIASYIGKVKLARVGHYSSKYLSVHFLDKTNPDILVLLADNAKSGQTYTKTNDITLGLAFMNSKSGSKTIGHVDQAYPMVFEVNDNSVDLYNNQNGSLTPLTKTLNSSISSGWYSYKDKNPAVDNWVYISNSKMLKGIKYLPIGNGESRYAYFYFQEESTPNVSAGIMKTGWQEVNGTWYYFCTATGNNKVKGEALTGWQKIARNGTNYWYYFDSQGKMKTGWIQLNNIWYYLTEEADMFTDYKYKGAMVTGLKKLPYNQKNYIYYMDENGAMQTGWKKINGYWYYFATSSSEFSGYNKGAAVTDVRTINGKVYCFNSEGRMTTNSNVSHYSCDANGIATNWKIKVTTKWLERNTDNTLVASETKTYGYGSSYTTTKKTIDGYDFVSSTSNTSGTATGSANGSTINVIYYYKKHGTYNITYDLDGGSVSGNPIEYKNDTETFTLKNPTKKGYTFAGWTGTDLSKKTKTVTIAKGTTGDRTYTANWTQNKVYIRFNMNGGSLSSTHGEEYATDGEFITKNGSLNVQSLKYGTSFSSTGLLNYNNSGHLNIIKTGHKAVPKAEWKTKDGSKTYNQSTSYKASDFCDASNSNCTVDLYVNWTPNKIYVKMNMNGGYLDETHGSTIGTIDEYITLNNSQNIHTLKYGSSLPSAGLANYNNKSYINIKRKGYKAVSGEEWKNSDGSKKYCQATQYKASELCNAKTNNCTVTLYVNWMLVDYTITYKLNGGIASNNPNNYNITSDTITLNNPTKTGYTFTGWTGSNSDEPQTTVTIDTGSTGNKTYTANWKVNKYKITFNSNGGSTVNAIKVNYNASITKPTDPTKEGYTFAGWYSDSSLTKPYTFNKMPAKNITLYAKWTQN